MKALFKLWKSEFLVEREINTRNVFSPVELLTQPSISYFFPSTTTRHVIGFPGYPPALLGAGLLVRINIVGKYKLTSVFTSNNDNGRG